MSKKQMTLEQLGKLLQKIREKKGIGPYQLATRAGIRTERIKAIETGKGCNASTLLKYINALDCWQEVADYSGKIR